MRHRLHALCPYFAMFPETFAEKWITNLTRPDDTILDPFCGRGTAPFQALLMGRKAIGCDVNPVAYCITRAKTAVPERRLVEDRIHELEDGFAHDDSEALREDLPEFFHWAYCSQVLRQLLFLRERLDWRGSDTDCMVSALVLGSLHGESRKSAAYLSNQMPRTISTKPAYSVRFWKARDWRPPEREVFDVLRAQLAFRYESEPARGPALTFHSDMRELPWLLKGARDPIRCAITSPPYLDTTNFEEDQWLRLWFLGGPPHPTRNRVSRDDRHCDPVRYWNLISDLWRVLGQVLDSDADIVIRLGGRRLTPGQMVGGLAGTSVFAGRPVALIHHETSALRGRQTRAFRPGSTGTAVEVDCHFRMH